MWNIWKATNRVIENYDFFNEKLIKITFVFKFSKN